MRGEIPETRARPDAPDGRFPRSAARAWIWSLVTRWPCAITWSIRAVPVMALESSRGAKSASKEWFRLQSASNSPKTHVFGTMRSVSRRPITVAVFRRAVRHHRAPARRSTPSPTPRMCPAVAESASAENRRMATAALCGRVRASGGTPAGLTSVDGPDRSRGRLDRRRERLGVLPGAQNSSFSPKFTLIWLSRVVPRTIVRGRDAGGSRASSDGPRRLDKQRAGVNLGENELF